jgi:hypothetical protein
MNARVTKPFPGRADDSLQVRDFEAGEIITGQLAAAMVAAGFAQELKAEVKAEAAGARDANDLAGLKIDELKGVAAACKIDLGDAKKKDDIAAAIELAHGAADAGGKAAIDAAVAAAYAAR